MMRGHRGLLGVVAMLAAFGLEGPPPPEPEIDLAEVAKVLDLLAAAGIASPDVLEAAGSPARFIVTDGREAVIPNTGPKAAQARPKPKRRLAPNGARIRC